MDKRNFYINGQWVKPSQPNDFTVINPATEEACATISLGSQADTDAAVAAARTAFNSWSQTPVTTRIELLEAIYEQYKKHSDDLIAAISMEMGAP
ncbi:MAG: aldehyde dehydrogenase family protein, partial [Proteobacteria bacterium]|nr:aldehyde dehydrogenase family protein [Pseudomonadota bacterium]